MSNAALAHTSYSVAVSGYYGCGNAGDEAVLAGIREGFASLAPEKVRLTVLSANPEETIRLHSVRAVDRMRLTSLLRIMREADLLISGGGSLLQDTTSIRSLLYYLWIIRMAYAHKVPVMFFAQGLGPLHRPLSRSLVRIAANRANYITVRDEPSKALLAQLRVTRPPIELTADPAFALIPAESGRVDQIRREEGLDTPGGWIGLSLRPWGGAGESPLESYAHLIDELIKSTGLRVVLIPMQLPNDLRFAETVRLKTLAPDSVRIVRGSYTPAELMGLVGTLSAVAAMRLHALIFAARMCVPPFALSYDPKVENLMTLLGLTDSMDHWRGFDPVEVADRIAAIIRERPIRVEGLQQQHAKLRGLALNNVHRALGLLSIRSPRA